MSRRGYWMGWRGACVLAVVLASMCRVPREHAASVHVPAAPDKLAHMLADFTNYPKIYPHMASWSIDEESNSMSAWRYSATYECEATGGSRCGGRVAVLADQPGHHRVLAQHRHCTPLQLLPWTTCSWLENEVRLSAEGHGTRALLVTRAACPVATLLGSCTRYLREENQRLITALQQLTQ